MLMCFSLFKFAAAYVQPSHFLHRFAFHVRCYVGLFYFDVLLFDVIYPLAFPTDSHSAGSATNFFGKAIK